MLKKNLIFSIVLMVMSVLCANASTWKMHNYYVPNKMQNIYDAGDKVYYLNSNSLFRYDKATGITEALNKQNLLSDNRISQIYYDWENRLLFIAYTNSNIDVIDANGKVTNIPNIKNIVSVVHNYSLVQGDISSSVSKEIRDITFGGGMAYVTFGYGYVTIDESTLKVTNTYDLGQSICINSVCLMGETLIILSNNRCYWGAPGEPDPIKNYQNKTGDFSYANRKTYPLSDNSFFIYGASGGVYRCDFETGSPVTTRVSTGSVTSIQKCPSGFYANFIGVKAYQIINATGTSSSQYSELAILSSDPLGDGTVWMTDANGLHIQGSTDYHMINSVTTDEPFWLRYNGVLNKLYVGVTGPNKIYNTSGVGVANVINTYDGNTWANATAYTSSGAGYQFEFNPTDPHMYVRAGWSNGVHKVRDDVRITNYTSNNSLISNVKPTPCFDKYGNLWVVSSYNAPANPGVVLTRDKVNKTSVTKTDWFVPTGLQQLNTVSMQRSRFIVSKKTNLKIFTDGDFPTLATGAGFIWCWDNGNEDPTVDTYQLSKIAHFVDQDNRQIDWVHINALEEDRDGNIWVGHDAGVFMFNPSVAFDLMPRATRPYTSKFSEGKGFLCDTYMVYDIGIDRENNKWIATNGNGLYYASPDGSEVYNHFTIENSDIPSDVVYSVECDTVNNRVYIFTDNGFAEFIEAGDAPALNFDNVYAFPNPVEPNFTGMIKITNLMENSYVIVTDHDGNTVAQFGPVMGSALWDGSDATGERVPTGLYNIYAAQGGQPATTGTPLATVMIIK